MLQQLELHRKLLLVLLLHPAGRNPPLRHLAPAHPGVVDVERREDLDHVVRLERGDRVAARQEGGLEHGRLLGDQAELRGRERGARARLDGGDAAVADALLAAPAGGLLGVDLALGLAAGRAEDAAADAAVVAPEEEREARRARHARRALRVWDPVPLPE